MSNAETLRAANATLDNECASIEAILRAQLDALHVSRDARSLTVQLRARRVIRKGVELIALRSAK